MCNCVDIEVGSYGNQVELEAPNHMKEYLGQNTICVDACLVDEIKNLWACGITTTGCCCGHNKVEPYIGVIEKDIVFMKYFKYKTKQNHLRPHDMDSFIPKSI